MPKLPKFTKTSQDTTGFKTAFTKLLTGIRRSSLNIDSCSTVPKGYAILKAGTSVYAIPIYSYIKARDPHLTSPYGFDEDCLPLFSQSSVLM